MSVFRGGRGKDLSSVDEAGGEGGIGGSRIIAGIGPVGDDVRVGEVIGDKDHLQRDLCRGLDQSEAPPQFRAPGGPAG